MCLTRTWQLLAMRELVGVCRSVFCVLWAVLEPCPRQKLDDRAASRDYQNLLLSNASGADISELVGCIDASLSFSLCARQFRKIPVTQNLDIIPFLVDIGTIGDWNIQGLPTDPLSIQNGILVTRSSR